MIEVYLVLLFSRQTQRSRHPKCLTRGKHQVSTGMTLMDRPLGVRLEKINMIPLELLCIAWVSHGGACLSPMVWAWAEHVLGHKWQVSSSRAHSFRAVIKGAAFRMSAACRGAFHTHWHTHTQFWSTFRGFRLPWGTVIIKTNWWRRVWGRRDSEAPISPWETGSYHSIVAPPICHGASSESLFSHSPLEECHERGNGYFCTKRKGANHQTIRFGPKSGIVGFLAQAARNRMTHNGALTGIIILSRFRAALTGAAFRGVFMCAALSAAIAWKGAALIAVIWTTWKDAA